MAECDREMSGYVYMTAFLNIWHIHIQTKLIELRLVIDIPECI